MPVNECVLNTLDILSDLKGPKENIRHYGWCTGNILGPPHHKTPTAVITNKI